MHEDDRLKPNKQSETADPGQGTGADHNKVEEIGGPKGPEPTRYGDWEKAGRCIDF